MKILLEGPILSQSGYGEHARLIYRALKSSENLEIHINPLLWGKTNWVNYLDKKEEESINHSIREFYQEIAVAKQNSEQSKYDLHVYIGYVSEYKRRAEHSVCVTAGIETDKISKNWVLSTYNNPPDKIIFPSSHSMETFRATSYPGKDNHGNKILISANKDCKLEVIPYPIKNYDVDNLKLNIETKFNFLSIATGASRKNTLNMISWFVQEFKDESVGLVLKLNRKDNSLIDREKTVDFVKKALDKYQDRKCKVYLLHGDLTDSQIHSLYKREDIHAYLTTTRGEGYGLPIFEAAYCGLPIVATDWSGHLDFLSAPYKQSGKIKDKKLFAKIRYDLVEVPEKNLSKDVIEKGSKWAEPIEKSAKKQMREVYNNYGMYKKWALTLKDHIEKTHSEEKILETMRDSIIKGCKPQGLQAPKLQELEGYSDEIIL